MKLFLTNSSGTSNRRRVSLRASVVQQSCHTQLGMKAAQAVRSSKLCQGCMKLGKAMVYLKQKLLRLSFSFSEVLQADLIN